MTNFDPLREFCQSRIAQIEQRLEQQLKTQHGNFAKSILRIQSKSEALGGLRELRGVISACENIERLNGLVSAQIQKRDGMRL